MKKLLLFALLCSSCSSILPKPEVKCEPAPASVYGTKMVGCQGLEGQNITCCSYAHQIDLGDGTETCTFVLCQQNCGSWDLIVGQCVPSPVVLDPADITL